MVSAACCRLLAFFSHQSDFTFLVYCWRFLFDAVYLLLIERVLVWSIFIFALLRCFRRTFRCLSVLSNQSWCLRFGFSQSFSAVLYTTILRAFHCNSTFVFCSRTSLSLNALFIFFSAGPLFDCFLSYLRPVYSVLSPYFSRALCKLKKPPLTWPPDDQSCTKPSS